MSKKVHSDLDFAGVAKVVNHPDPVNPQDAATRAYVLATVAPLPSVATVKTIAAYL